jgi:hypothetical protein
MWTVSYNEYLQFDGVKKSIQETKYKKKMQIKEGNGQYGMMVEETIYKLLCDTGLTIKHTTPQVDIGFGADFLVSYTEEDKNYSFYVDVTTSQKDIVKYFSLSGETTEYAKEAFSYQTEYGNFYFGVKEKHANWFFYEKPVVVLYIENFVPSTGLAISHLTNIKSILTSLNYMLVRKEYGARASKLVRPNPRKFPEEFKKAMDTYK